MKAEISLSEEELERIQALDPESTLEDIIKRAISFFEKVVERVGDDEKIISVDDIASEVTYLEMPWMKEARKSGGGFVTVATP